jgi:hypothetical protein
MSLVLLLSAAPGCGSVMYTANILGATAALEEARLADAERLSPYEYYYARACWEKARESAGDAEYQHAVELADSAREHALRARDLSRSGGASSGGSASAAGAADAGQPSSESR